MEKQILKNNYSKFITNFLGFRYIWTDLKKLGWKIQLFLFLIITWYIIWAFGGFGLNKSKLDGWTFVALISVICSAVGGMLMSSKKISNYIWNVPGVILYALYAGHIGYIGAELLNFFFYFPIFIIGSYFWNINMNNKSNVVKIKKWELKYIIIGLVTFAILTIALWYVIPYVAQRFTSKHRYKFSWWSWQHILDTLTSSLGILAQAFIEFRMAGQILYLLQGPLELSMWIIMFDLNIIIMLFIYSISTFVGIYKWYELDRFILRISNMFKKKFHKRK